MNASDTESPETVQVKSAESAPASVQALESPVSVSVMVNASAAVVPSRTDGVVSVAE